VIDYGAKYPLMSINTSVALLANTLIAPLLPAGTMAALPTTPPLGAFTVEAFGSVSPTGNAVKYPKLPPEGTTTVRFKEYACAELGIAHELCCTGKVRVAPPTSEGGPNAPLNPNAARVSATRQGARE
jgi:hypothetical protein